MKHKLLHIILILTATAALQALLNPFVISIYRKPMPFNIAPAVQKSIHHSGLKKKYTPAQLQRIYFHEHVHQSIKKGIKGKVN